MRIEAGNPTRESRLSVQPDCPSHSPQIGLLRALLIMLAILVVMLVPARRARGEGATREYEIKAAFIYNFAQFVEWPAGSFPNDAAPLVIGVVGDDPFHGALEHAVEGKSVGGHPLTIRHFATGAEAQGCHLIFAAADSENQFVAAQQKVGQSAVLTVGESEQFIQDGGMIRFYTENNRERFEVNQTAAERAGLRISAKLLRLAKIHNQ